MPEPQNASDKGIFQYDLRTIEVRNDGEYETAFGRDESVHENDFSSSSFLDDLTLLDAYYTPPCL